LAVGSRVIGTDLAKEILNTFIKSTFQAGRHQRRIEKIEEIERKYRERC
jgi:ribose 5-phosphate isomerase B